MKKLLIILSILFFAVSAYAGSALQVDFLLAGYRHPTTDKVLSGGKVETYLDGTSTLSALFTDKDQGGTATNPVILDSSGKAEVYGDQIYKFLIYDSNDVLIETLNGLQYRASLLQEKSLDADYGCDLPTALAAIGTVDYTELKIDCACIIASGTSATITDNISLNFINGGSFDGVASGGAETLTINGPVISGEYEIFLDDIVIVYGSDSIYKTAWRGGSLEDTVADIGSAENTVLINPNLLDLTASLEVPINISLNWGIGSTLGGAFTLTLGNIPIAENYQIFESDLTVVSDFKHRAPGEWFGAIADDITIDSTTAFQSAIDTFGSSQATQGTYYIDGTIGLGAAEGMFLKNNSVLKRDSSRTAATDPIILISGLHATIQGDNKRCQIVTDNAIQTGIIRVYADGEQAQHAVISGLAIVGSNGNSRGLFLSDNGSETSHYGSVSNIRIADVDTGVRQEENVNAWVFKDIQFNAIGTRSIDYNVTQENSWHGVFITGSSGQTNCLKIASGYANHFYGFIAEPGGGDYLTIDVNSNQNVVIGENNTGGSISDTGTSNLIIDSGMIISDSIIKGWVRFDGTGTVAIDDSFNVTSITDNGVGNYTINWTDAFADALYSAVGTTGLNTFVTIQTVAIGSLRIRSVDTANAVTDAGIINIIAIGDQ